MNTVRREKLGFVNADDIAKEFLLSRVAAGRRFVKAIGDAISDRKSFMVESTLSGRTFRDVLARASAAGFKVKIAFVFVDSPELCIHRVKQRTRRGGHHIPEEDIRRRFFRSCANFWHDYRPRADAWELFYNGLLSIRHVAYGERETIEIVHDDAWTKFFELIEE